jgi:hypothetical protein
VASETARVSALRQLDYSQSAARIRDPAAGLSATSWLSTSARVLAPRSGDAGSRIPETGTRTQYKADGVCFPTHPAAELVGRHSSILVDPFFARGLAICYDEISLPDQDLNQM